MGLYLPEYDHWDATDMAARVSAGEVTPADLLRAAEERLQARNPRINATTLSLLQRAHERVDALPEGPLLGVPMVLKDLLQTIEGYPTSHATKLLKAPKAKVTSELARRFEQAGLQIIAKTNTPELGIMGTTEPRLFGPTRNPWNTDHSAGGSSGGSAAAVAARIVPVGHGGDGGGSIRIPASACGLFGLKPSRGRNSLAPHLAEAWGGFVQEHVLTRSVRDSALILDLTHGVAPGDLYSAPPPTGSFLQATRQRPGALRIGYLDTPMYAGTYDPASKACLADALQKMEALGHHVERVTLPIDVPRMVHAYFVTVAANVAADVDEITRSVGVRPSPSDFEPATWLLNQIGKALDAREVALASRTVQHAAHKMAVWFQTFDLFLSPTIGSEPVRIGQLDLKGADKALLAVLRTVRVGALLRTALHAMADDALAATPNTQLFNQTGLPAMSVPLFTSPDGLPMGTQLAAGYGQEELLFRVAAQLEEAYPWKDRMPSWVADPSGATPAQTPSAAPRAPEGTDAAPAGRGPHAVS